jgi:hypothetical protein
MIRAIRFILRGFERRQVRNSSDEAKGSRKIGVPWRMFTETGKSSPKSSLTAKRT